MTKIIINLIRHGMTQANRDGLISGRTDRQLTPEGIIQIREQVEKGYYSQNVTYAFCSSLKRTYQTLKLIYPDVEYQENKLLDEIDFGEYEDSSYQLNKNDPEYIRWISQDNEMKITAPNGESIDETNKRIDLMFEYIFNYCVENKIAECAVVGHSNYFAQFIYRYLNDNRNVKERMDDYFANGRGIRLFAQKKNKKIEYSLIERI